ncbi:MAG: hypothetical protein LBU38_04430 [Propionibacteriaceae bacterium]|jgi:hypothetical protein|nr:hypothetical protein [Propionibacteriaceae bacterium]
MTKSKYISPKASYLQAMRGEEGMVTAEMAFASLFAALFLVVVAWMVSVLMLLLGSQNTAFEVARQEARGDVAAATKAKESAPAGALVTVNRTGKRVAVRVELQARPWARWLPAIPIQVESSVSVESG